MEIIDVFRAFKQEQSKSLGRGYKFPKDFDSYFENKLKSEQREIIRKLTRYLNTTWLNIDINKYFKYGFELWKGFSYHQFFKQQLINYYIQKEKSNKRTSGNIKKKAVESAKYIKIFMKDNNINNLKQYSRISDDFQPYCIKHYIQGHIISHMLVYLIYKKYLIINEDVCSYIPDIMQKYRDLRTDMIEMIDFFKSIEKALNGES